MSTSELSECSIILLQGNQGVPVRIEAQKTPTHSPLMKLNFKQLNLLSIALTVFYDEVCKTGTTPGMKKDIMELAKLVNDEFSEVSV